MPDYTRDQLQGFIDKIREEGRNLTKWEEDFVDNVEDQLRVRGTMSELQQETLERIYAEKTP